MSIEFTVINNDGDEVELPRSESKSLDDVRQVCRLHAGNIDKHFVIDLFIKLYLDGVQWDWHEDHKDWLEHRDQLLAYANLLPEIRDPDGDYVAQTKQELIDTIKPEPVRPTQLTIDEAKALIKLDGYSVSEYLFRTNRAAMVRKIVVDVDGLMFDGDEESQRRMLAAIHVAEVEALNNTKWVMADNSEQLVTLKQLKLAHSKAIIAQGELWLNKG